MLTRALKMDSADILAQLQASGLRGRGGAGFAMGTKASFLPKGDMDKYVVCNADESEPGMFKDRELDAEEPASADRGRGHRGARRRREQGVHLHPRRVRLCRHDRRDRARGGEGCEPARHARALVDRGAGAYICGEETALLDALEGKRGNPRLKPPFPAVQGLYQGPTLINNVETLMNAPIILRMGGEEYAKIGVERSTGTKVVSVSGCVERPGNYEIVLGTPTREIIYDLAGGPLEGKAIKCFFPGGSSAPVLPGTDEYLDLPYDFDSMAKAGSMLGSGAIIVADEDVSIVDLALKTAKFYRHESCGKCTPCREGTNWTVKMLERIDSGEATPMDLDIMSSVCDQIIGNCLCVLGDAMAMPIASMIKHFRAEFEAHIEAARERNGLGAAIPQVNQDEHAGPMPALT